MASILLRFDPFYKDYKHVEVFRKEVKNHLLVQLFYDWNEQIFAEKVNENWN